MVLDFLESSITMVLDHLKLLTATTTAAASGNPKRMVRNHWVETFLQFIHSPIFYWIVIFMQTWWRKREGAGGRFWDSGRGSWAPVMADSNAQQRRVWWEWARATGNSDWRQQRWQSFLLWVGWWEKRVWWGREGGREGVFFTQPLFAITK